MVEIEEGVSPTNIVCHSQPQISIPHILLSHIFNLFGVARHCLPSPQENPFSQNLHFTTKTVLCGFCLVASTADWRGLSYMESYCGDEGAWSRYQSQERCDQWGVDAVDSFGSLDKSTSTCATDEDDFSCVTLMDELEMECIVSKRVQAEFSGVPGGISESSNCWTTFLNNQDYQRTNQTDENFVNSLIVDDMRLSGQFHSYGSLKSQGTYSTSNNLTVDMSIDSPSDSNKLHNMGSYQHSDAQGLFDWEKKQSDASHENFPNMMNNAVPQQNTSLGNFETSVEETVLQEFGKAMHKMTEKTRLCFRDALYRLASNSDKSSGIQIQHGDGCTSEKPLATSLVDNSLRSADKQALEYGTNTIDRTIADLLMFNKELVSASNSSYSLKRPLAPL